MKYIKKNYFLYLTIFLFTLINLPKSFSNDSLFFLSLKNNEVNLRQGPSLEYPIKLIYKKKVFTSYNFR